MAPGAYVASRTPSLAVHSVFRSHDPRVSLPKSRNFNISHLRPRLLTLAAAANSSTNAPEDEEGYDEYCAPTYVTVDDRKNPNFTVVTVEVQDYPGLLRVLAWVLNGLEVVAQNAILSTSAEGIANNTFWLSTRSGKKLSDTSAELLTDRVREILYYCSPRPAENEQTEFCLGTISVSNSEHSQYTVITVREQRRTPGFLLEVASVLSGLNVQVLQGVIQGCVECGEDVPKGLFSEEPEAGARIFEFWVRNQQGKKMDVAQIKAVLYALGVGLGFTGQKFPLYPPNRDVMATR